MLTANTPTTTTIVNPAFLQEMKDSNSRLWSLLHELRETRIGDQELRTLAHRFVEGVDELRELLALQFSLEETYGFIDGVPRSSGSKPADAMAAKIQHRELYLQIHEIGESAEEAEYRGTIHRDLPQLLEDYQAFNCAFQAHEDLEAELIRTGLGA